jgi:hypothetical protein
MPTVIRFAALRLGYAALLLTAPDLVISGAAISFSLVNGQGLHLCQTARMRLGVVAYNHSLQNNPPIRVVPPEPFPPVRLLLMARF